MVSETQTYPWRLKYYLEHPQTSWGSPKEIVVTASTAEQAQQVALQELREQYGEQQTFSFRSVQRDDKAHVNYRSLNEVELAAYVCSRLGTSLNDMSVEHREQLLQIVKLTCEGIRWERTEDKG